MPRRQAFKYELMPNGAQENAMRRCAGSCRFVDNKALALRKEHHAADSKFSGYGARAKHLTGWCHGLDTPRLKEAPCHPLQQTLKDLDKAYQNFCARRPGFPRCKGRGDAFCYSDPHQTKRDQANHRLFLPRLGWLRYRHGRDVLVELRNVTVSQAGGKWFVSIQTQRDIEPALPTSTTAIGIDVGIARFATLSGQTYIAPLGSVKKHQQYLACYQRRMRRKARHPRCKFSNNWNTANARVQKIHTRIANARKDFLHKNTTMIRFAARTNYARRH